MANTIGWGQAAVNNTIDWGKGKTNNAIGWGSVYSSSPSGETDISGTPATDADANAFIAAAAITDTTQKAAIDKLVVDLKGYGIWTKMKALYPFIGGTAAQHKFNLKNPLDTDAAFRLVFNGGWTHSSTGAKPNGVNGFANTYLFPNLNLINNNYHLSHYSRTQKISTNSVDIGCNINTAAMVGITQYYNAISSKAFVAGNYNNAYIYASNTDTLGFQIGSRISQTSAKLFMDGSQNGSELTISNSSSLPDRSLYIGANNTEAVPVGTEWSDKECAFASIGDGLTDTEASNYYTAVQAFQTTLSRNV